jgi:hypothetical protein
VTQFVLAFLLALGLAPAAFAQMVPSPAKSDVPIGMSMVNGATGVSGSVTKILLLFSSAGTCPSGSITSTFTVPAGGIVLTELEGRTYLVGVGFIGLTVTHTQTGYQLFNASNSNQVAAGAKTDHATENWGNSTWNLAAGIQLTTTANCTPGLYGQWDVYGYVQ